MAQKLITVKAKIGKCIYNIEMDKILNEIIQEVALQHDIPPERVQILGIMDKEKSWPPQLPNLDKDWMKELIKTGPTLEEFKKQYMQSPH